ncbi:peptide/nickel transport system permease protein [Deinobacterium chartae]|uniref:Peptide/nickel transport system permease protein n=1 Tax=Deinobacterium chartae TaxID=521158 RepID=A0A841HYW6_9DEIO|nr:ABC transporter permease [Deinobacterium chartae]MBB6098587.1 peptide/nickel transport system permease protein [Deinobacterium chartae]
MLSFFGQRLGQGAVVLVLISLITFSLINLAPGGPSSAVRLDTTAEQREVLIKQLGLDRPLAVRYLEWGGGVLRGDFGTSMNGGEPVGPKLLERLGNTAQLALAALVLSVVVGIPLGILTALRKNSPLDHAVNGVTTLGMSIPDFWTGIMAILLFAVTLKVLPSAGMYDASGGFSLSGWLRHTILPASVLAFVMLPNLVRFTRSSLLEVLRADYLRSARAKGLSERIVILKHALRNALVPIVAMVGLILPALLSGSVIVESVFGWPGMGRMAVDAALGRDYTTVMAVTVVAGAVVIITNLVVDLAYTLIDPRIRHD